MGVVEIDNPGVELSQEGWRGATAYSEVSLLLYYIIRSLRQLTLECGFICNISHTYWEDRFFYYFVRDSFSSNMHK